MKVTFPHMGNTYIPLKVVMEELGIDVVIPPKCNKKTLEIGTKLSPEFMCMPFKINVGNYIQSIEQGAEAILMISSCGDVCRLGMFHNVQEDILKDLGYDIKMIPVMPFGNVKQIKSFLNDLKFLGKVKSDYKIATTFIKSVKTLFAVDALYEYAYKTRAREIVKGETDRIYGSFEENIKEVKGYKETINLIKDTRKQLGEIEINEEKNVLKIGIIGEIYTVVEPFSNHYIEKRLGNMGVEVSKLMTTSEFIREHIEFLPFVKSNVKEVIECAKPYLQTGIGGHTLQTVGSASLYSKRGYDGLIHILPFGCMPEVVSMGILPKIEKDEDIPVMTLIFDEMTGEGGYITRIEAFIDLLERRKRKVDVINEESLSWN